MISENALHIFFVLLFPIVLVGMSLFIIMVNRNNVSRVDSKISVRKFRISLVLFLLFAQIALFIYLYFFQNDTENTIPLLFLFIPIITMAVPLLLGRRTGDELMSEKYEIKEEILKSSSNLVLVLLVLLVCLLGAIIFYFSQLDWPSSYIN